MDDSRRNNLTFIKRVPLLADLPADRQRVLAETCTVEDYKRRRVVYMPGDPSPNVYFVVSGRVKISRVTPDGKELTLSYRAAGETFGDSTLIDSAPREEMAETVDGAMLALIPREHLLELLAIEHQFARALALMLAEQRRRLERHIEHLIFKDVHAKLATLLIDLAEHHGMADSRGTLIALKITHQEMANLIGSTRETVSLTLSQFKRDGLIATDGRKVIVSNRDALRALM